ncbi:hypothetical protein IJG14_07855 [bacterium]|nr:hypothetical protein [bacterium]
MGYALFTARKMSLQAQVNNLNLQLMQLNNKQKALTEKNSAFQKQQDARKAGQQRRTARFENAQRTANAASQANSRVNQGIEADSFVGNTFNLFSGMGSTVVDQGINTAGDMADIACLGNEVRNIYENADMDNEANTHQTEAAIEQQQIDTEKTRIETLLQAAQAELKSVTEAEKSAIQSSAPAYVG